MMRLNSSLIVLAIVFLATSECQSAEGEQNNPKSDISHRDKGRSLFDFGILRKIYQFFGWGNENQKLSRRYPAYYKRPETLPYEIQHSPNRRSGLEPPSDLISHRKKKWPHTGLKSKSMNKLRGKNFNKERFNLGRFSTFKPYGNFKSIKSYPNDKSQYNNIMKNFVDESIYLHELTPKPVEVKKQREIKFTDKLPQAQPLKAATVESREPVVAVYNNGIKTKTDPPSYGVKENTSSVVHSKFALKNYAPENEKYTPKPQIKVSLTSKKINNLVTAKSVHVKKEKPHLKKYPHELKNPVHPYPYENPHSYLPQSQSQNHYSDEDPILAQGHGPDPIYATPVRGNIITRKKKVQKERGIIENMSNFASNLFGSIFSRSSATSPSPSTQPYPQRRRQRNPPVKFIPPSTDSLALPSSLKSKSNDPFTPSPQQGSMSIDSFQPIFVPSYSMDSKLPNDVMMPLIIPQKRQSEVIEDDAPKEPELINFFS